MADTIPNAYFCGTCQRDSVACNCPFGPAHLCTTCGLAPSFDGFDDCVACGAAYLLTDPTQLALIRKLNAGTPWLAQLNAEIERQLSALIVCGRAA